MGDYITTYTGKHFVPTAADSKDICIEDVAHALSLICRGNGHTVRFFSVGQHSINCCKEAKARGYSIKVQLACLLHDASEAYMSDITRPFKQHLKDYLNFEKQLQDVIYIKYLGEMLTDRDEMQVKSIDDDMLYYELKELLNEHTKQLPPAMCSNICLKSMDFDKVEEEFKNRFEILMEKNI